MPTLIVALQHDMGELGLLILEKAYGRFDTVRPASLDKLQFTQVPIPAILPHQICLRQHRRQVTKHSRSCRKLLINCACLLHLPPTKVHNLL